jgi:SAM-dependent methyltransferase
MYKIPADVSKGVAQFYTEEEYTGDYAALHDDEDQEAAAVEFTEVLQRVLERLGPQRGRLLDVGCAAGQFMEIAKSAGFTVSGIEINPAAAETARQRTGCQVFIIDLDNEVIPEVGYDVIVMLDLIEHVQDPLALLQRARRALAKNGRLVVFTPNHGGLIVKVARALDKLSGGRLRGPIDHIFDCVHVTFFTVPSLRKTIEAAGFTLEATDLIRYRPERRKEAGGIAAAGLRMLEAVSVVVPNGRFRILTIATPQLETTGS